MYICLTLWVSLISSILLVENWLYGKYLKSVWLPVPFVSATVIYFILFSFWKDGAFGVALLSGQTACLIYEIICRERRILLSKTCLYLGFDAIWLPLCFCGKDIWQYAFFSSLLILCLSLIQTDKDDKQKHSDILDGFYTDKRKRYYVISFLPCANAFPSILISAVYGRQTVLSAFVTSAVLLIFYIVLLLLQHEISVRITAEEMNNAMNRWQRESRDYMNTIRSQRHDFNLHLHAISGLINSKEYEKCSEYIQKLVSDANAVNDIMPVSDAVVGSMLYNMREEARRRGSDIIYHITYDMEDIICNGFECNKIIGNLLQNAIDALHTPEDKEYGIRLNIFKRRGNTVITTENRFTGDPDKIARAFETGYSTKKGHDGIGLSMVLRTAEQYGGRVYPEFEDDKIRFVVNIPNKVHLLKGDETV